MTLRIIQNVISWNGSKPSLIFTHFWVSQSKDDKHLRNEGHLDSLVFT